MIGDTNVYGEYPISVDAKSRMILPVQTGVEENEDILILSINDEKYIISQHLFDEYVDRINNDLMNATNIEDMNRLIQLNDHLCSMVIKQTKADKQHRVSVSDVLEPKAKAKVRGMGKYIKLLDK